MGFSFLKGRQMIVHDYRLDYEGEALSPPPAMNTWTVKKNNSPEGIFNWVATVAKGDSGDKQLDALHFMAHGSVGGMQLGSGRLGWHNYELFKKLEGRIRGAVVFFSCKVGGEQHNHSLKYSLTFGNAIAKTAKCKVLVCRINQLYTHRKKVIDFGDFESVVYLYTATSDGAKMLNYSAKSKVDMDEIIFA